MRKPFLPQSVADLRRQAHLYRKLAFASRDVAAAQRLNELAEENAAEAERLEAGPARDTSTNSL